MKTLEIYRRDDDLWDWRVKAPNHEIIATSGGQGFTERNDARESAVRVFGRGFDETWEVSLEEDKD